MCDRASERGRNEVAFVVSSQDGDTALIRAGYHGEGDVVGLLLDRGANIEAKGKVNCPDTPQLAGASGRRLEVSLCDSAGPALRRCGGDHRGGNCGWGRKGVVGDGAGALPSGPGEHAKGRGAGTGRM